MAAECSICFEETRDENGFGILKSVCGHLYHENCIKLWLDLSATCPVCRQLVFEYELMQLNETPRDISMDDLTIEFENLLKKITEMYERLESELESLNRAQRLLMMADRLDAERKRLNDFLRILERTREMTPDNSS